MVTNVIDVNALINMSIKSAEGVRQKSRQWNAAEDAFLAANLGKLTDAQIGKALGRTSVAVHLRWIRDLQLQSPSKADDVITANLAALSLGIDSHKVAHWVDKGFIPGRLMAGNRKIRLIKREDFQKWVLEPMHWMYFDIDKVQDEELKKLLQEKAREWNDEWWRTPRVAKYHGVATGDVKRYIKAGRIKATQIQYSYGGRDPELRWRLWFVLKSEATRKTLKFVRRKKAS